MEAVTAFLWGPLSLLAVYAIARRWPWRHVMQAGHPPLCLGLHRATAESQTPACVQIAISLGQLYGDVLYFATTYVEGAPSGPCWRPEKHNMMQLP